jgi:hypothetical protein
MLCSLVLVVTGLWVACLATHVEHSFYEWPIPITHDKSVVVSKHFYIHCSLPLHFSQSSVNLLLDIVLCIPQLFILYRTRIYSSLQRREADHSPPSNVCRRISLHFPHRHVVILHKLNIGTTLHLPLIFRPCSLSPSCFRRPTSFNSRSIFLI